MAITAALLPIPATPAHAEPEESVEPLVVERVTPDAVSEDSTLRITGEVTNTTDEDLGDVSVRVHYSRHPFADRDELDEFASGEGWQPSASGPDTEVTGQLAPGDAGEYSLSVPAEDLDLDSYGVYPLVVEAVDGGGNVLGAQHTFLPYTGAEDDAPSVDIAWVWPLMAQPQRVDDDTFRSEALHEAVAPEGRLGRLLSAGAQTPLSFDPGDEDLVELLGLDEDPVASPDQEEATAEASPEDGATEDGDQEEQNGEASQEEEEPPRGTGGVPITWAVDPGTLDDIRRAASSEHQVLEDLLAASEESDPVRHDAEASEAAQVWLREARRVLGAETVVATPYANADLASLLRNDMRDEAEASLRLAEQAVPRALETEADGTFALPPGGQMDEGVHELFAAHEATRYLLDESAMPASSWMSTTPTAQAALPATETEPDEDPFALVADSGLTEVLSMPTSEPGQSELALQRFAAETAMIAGENAGGDRVVVAAPEEEWNPSQEFAQGVLSASEDLPWLSPERLDAIGLAASEERERTRETLTYPDRARGEELSGTYLETIRDVGRDVRLFNSILADDRDPFRPALLRLESVYWREEEALAGAARALLADAVQEHMDDVRVIPGEPVTLASRTGTTGILVANDLRDETVFVNLSVFSQNSERLSVGEYNRSFEIEPGAKTTVYVPLSARVNGRTVLNVSLQNAEGEPISSQSTEIPVNATGLGTQALLISGIGLLILVVALAPRALRKWARRRTGAARASEESDPVTEDARDSEDAQPARESDSYPEDPGSRSATAEDAKRGRNDTGR